MATLTLTVFFTENGDPKTGLSPTVTVWDLSDSSVDVNAQAMTEVAGGWYKYSWASFDLTKDYVGRSDGGAAQPTGERYAPIDMAGAALSGKVDAMETKIDTIDGIVDSILEDTGTTIPGTITTAQNDLDLITGADGATLATLQGNYAPNVVVPDPAGTAPTADEIKTAIEAAGSSIASILEDTGTTIPAAISALNDVTVGEILAGAVEGSTTLQQVLAVALSALAGLADGGNSDNITFRNQADSVDRIAMAVNESGDRSAVVFDFSDL